MDYKEGSVIYNEVIVKFADKEKRDLVASRGIKLAPYVDEKNKPTCGMRLQVPTRDLLPTFNMLNRYGFHLRRNEGENKKNNVRFDDYKQSLYLQVKLKNDKRGEWLTYDPD